MLLLLVVMLSDVSVCFCGWRCWGGDGGQRVNRLIMLLIMLMMFLPVWITGSAQEREMGVLVGRVEDRYGRREEDPGAGKPLLRVRVVAADDRRGAGCPSLWRRPWLGRSDLGPRSTAHGDRQGSRGGMYQEGRDA
ncbi:hypothetical protein F4802DRAFT_493124 [Xylaria palmicola]|nr:hypothetical protein F4802DRAFT_493124 [Xylaria palmicola]